MLFEPTLDSVPPEGLELFLAVVDMPPAASKVIEDSNLQRHQA